MREALLKLRGVSHEFLDIIRYIDNNQLFRGKDGRRRLLEPECLNKNRKKVLMNYFRRTKHAMEEMGEYSPAESLSASP